MKSKRAWFMGTIATGTVVAATVSGGVYAKSEYPPYIERFAEKYSLKTEDVQSLFDEVAPKSAERANHTAGSSAAGS